MNERKLISTTDFVLEQKEYIKEVDKLSFFEIQIKINEFYDKVVHHTTQMKRPLEKGMFIVCDDEGNVLEEPKESNYNLGDIHAGYFKLDVDKYQQAKERILFKGFYSTDENTVSNGEIKIIFGNLITLFIHGDNGYGGISKSNMIIEDLVDYNLTITDDF